MRKILTQALKELTELKHDLSSLLLAIFLPLIIFLLFSWGLRMESVHVPIAVCDFSNSNSSRELFAGLSGAKLFAPCLVSRPADLSASLDAGRCKSAILIPADFEQSLLNAEPNSILMLVDGTDVVNAHLIDAAIKATFQNFLESRESGKPLIRTNTRIWFNPGLREDKFIVPGVIAVVLWIFPSLFACISASKERESSTDLQIFASSISASEFVLGKSAAYLSIGIAQAALLIALSIFVLGLSFAVNPLLFLLAMIFYLLCSVLFGLAIGSWASSQRVAVQALSTLGFFTCLLLSGFVYPVENIPFPLDLLSAFVPARYFIEISRSTFVHELPWSRLCADSACLLLFAMVFYWAACAAWQDMQLQE